MASVAVAAVGNSTIAPSMATMPTTMRSRLKRRILILDLLPQFSSKHLSAKSSVLQRTLGSRVEAMVIS